MLFTSIHTVEDKKKHYTYLPIEDGKCLAVFQEYIGLYKNLDAVNDPLGNGLLALIEIPDYLKPYWRLNDQTYGYVTHMQGGCLFLTSGAIVLVKPNKLQLFETANNALHNVACLAEDAIALH